MEQCRNFEDLWKTIYSCWLDDQEFKLFNENGCIHPRRNIRDQIDLKQCYTLMMETIRILRRTRIFDSSVYNDDIFY